ncbi:MAG: hypothetical protein KJ860_00050 [Gammaproteobacteria bacterium]|nr:hypothetical protein [Gammaproteobacteria bacterium]MBU1530523.1 hypothetical protein [Gammaproteobacteria bacterium]
MIPQVDIKKIRDQYFNYSVSIGNVDDERHGGHGLCSIAECVYDAATALGQHFATAAISYEGQALGRFPVAHMEHKTAALATMLQAKLSDGAASMPQDLAAES